MSLPGNPPPASLPDPQAGVVPGIERSRDVKRSPLAQFAAYPYHREVLVIGLLIVAFAVSGKLSPYFWDVRYLLDASSLYMETGLIALAMTFIIISGNIDLSVASTLALVASATAVLTTRFGVPFGLALLCGLILGALLGLFNGLLIVKMRLPSLVVTLGTFALYRGIAQILVGDHSISQFPEWFTGIDYRRVVGPVPLPLVIFLGLAVIFALVLHRTVLGRWTVAIGTNAAASRYSGIPTGFTVLLLFTLSGLMAAVAGMMMTSRLGVARYDMATGLELDVITAVVLGGTDIFGGRGTILGTVTALFLIGILRSGMGLANIKIESQLVVIGLLLIFSVVFANLLERRR